LLTCGHISVRETRKSFVFVKTLLTSFFSIQLLPHGVQEKQFGWARVRAANPGVMLGTKMLSREFPEVP
jgi:hypothetical protein